MHTPVTHLGSRLLSACQADRDLFDNYIITILDESGDLIGLRWPYSLNDQGAYSPAKTRKGVWTGDYWKFPSSAAANSMLGVLQKKFPGVPVLDEKKADPESGNAFAVMSVSVDTTACILAREISYFTSIPGLIKQRNLFCGGMYPFPSGHEEPVSVYRVQEFTAGAALSLVVILAAPDIIKRLVDGIAANGAIETPALAHQFHINSKVKIATSGWAVEIQIDLNDPRNWKLLSTNNMRPSDGGLVKVASTRRKWGAWRARIEKSGLEWEGDDPDAQDLSVPTNFDERRVAGWSTPAPNGHLLHAYQKTGAQFCAARGMRALLGDEMGVGKTVQAIAAAEATSAPRIVIICPANARYVWQREIQGWGGVGSIQHVSSQLDTLDPTARWHILTYDLIATRAETWRLMDEVEVKAFIKECPELATDEVIQGAYPRKVSLDKPLDGVPSFVDSKRLKAWEKMMQRLRGELLEQILSAGQMLVILDEAHRVKNRGAKRTKAIQRIAAGEAQVLMLTGTPLRNNQHEAAVLLGLLDASAADALNSKNGYGIQDVKDYLSYFMLRRTKAEVLPELPEKTRQRIDLDKLDLDSLEQYQDALAMAQRLYLDALKRGTSEAEARQAMQGSIEKARAALGVAKVLGGGVADLVLDVVENKGCCVVFCAHHSASDALKAQLEQENLKVAVIDGRVAPKARATIVAEFQAGQLDVVIGGINAAGEAITLTRADTVIFVELDWVPAALLQAEDRIHRVGQKGNCQVIQLVARMDGENLDEMMVGLLSKKMEVIGAVLDEDTSSIVASSIMADLHNILLKKDTNDSALPPTHQKQEPDAVIETVDEGTTNLIQAVGSAESKPKPRRGRPKVYINAPPPTSTERSKQSIKALAAAGGKRVMLRLSAEAHEALQVIMAITGGTQETATINQALVARKNELLRTSTQK